MTEVFIVMETSFGYNDEVYSPEGGGTPLLVCKNRSDAEALATRKTLEKLRELVGSSDHYGLAAYGYEADELFNDIDKACKLFECDDEDDLYEKLMREPFNFTDAQLTELAGILCISFYEVCVCEGK